MARPRAKAPARSYHISGQSVVRLDGKDYYLGTHDSPEAIARYAVLIANYQSGGMTLPDDFELNSVDGAVSALLGGTQASEPIQQANEPIVVRHITALFRSHVAEKYKNTPQEKHRHERLCDQIDEQFGDVPANDFGPIKLKAFRDGLVKQGLARKYVNRLTNCVVTIFRNAVAGELIDVSRVESLRTLEPLRNGQTEAPETEEVEPVELLHVRATAVHLSPIVKAMLRIQVATGMRPKEICMMRPIDIDRRGELWIYRPSNHKTKWIGKKKAIPLVGDARAAITDYLNRDPESYCFNPQEAMAWRRAVGAANRKTPIHHGNRPGTNVKTNPKRKPRNQYDAQSYRQAIQRAAMKAGVPHWHPYQCRHLTATTIRGVLGIEETQALLGHSKAAMTEHYARESIEAATRAAKAAPKL
jgi:integrase